MSYVSKESAYLVVVVTYLVAEDFKSKESCGENMRLKPYLGENTLIGPLPAEGICAKMVTCKLV